MKKANVISCFLFFIFPGFLIISAQAQNIATGWGHSVFICNDRTAMTAGYNSYGQLGNGTNTDSNIPVPVSNLIDLSAVGAGFNHSIALKNDSTVWCWGNNTDGQIGDGTNSNRNVPVQVTSLAAISRIASGVNHNLALKDDSTVWTWGNNTYGQLGNGNTTNSNVPVAVSNLTGVIDIAGGSWHSLALKSDSTVWAWGNNGSGELGDGTYTLSSVPVQVSSLTGVIAVSAGQHFSLALKSDGTVWAWGDDNFYQLGNGAGGSSNVPVQVSVLTGITSISKGCFQLHTLAIKNDSTLWVWGLNDYGALGNGTLNAASVPIQVAGINDPSEVSAGNVHSIALLNDGTVWVWGWNLFGQLGNGGNTDMLVPVQPTGLCQMPAGMPVAAFVAPNDLCPGICIDFTSLSSNATTYLWNFPGASPSTSSDPNPQNICYPNPGNYDVELIVSNAYGSDTLVLSNYITVYNPPPPQGITQSGDTLFANPGAASYQWYFNGNLIPGATDYFYIATESGDYNMVATDNNGCEVEAVIFNVIASTPFSEGARSGVKIFPNPAQAFIVIGSEFGKTAFEVTVYNMLGEIVLNQITPAKMEQPPSNNFQGPGQNLHVERTVDISLLSPGIYNISVTIDKTTLHTKLIKN